MKGLETGKDKVKQICDVLRRETLEPAEHEAEGIIAAARKEADEILANAHAETKKMVLNANFEMDKQKVAFQASLQQASRQTIETLKEKIEHLFNHELSKLIAKPLQKPEVIAQLINAIVHAISKEGTQADLSAVISSTVSARAVNELLAADVIQKLKDKGVLLSSMGGGVEIKLLDDKVTIVLTNETLQELLANYIRKDFREYIFS